MDPKSLLRKYIRAVYRNDLHFCTENGLDPSRISKLLRGVQGQRITAQLAWDLDKATHGKVPYSAWVE